MIWSCFLHNIVQFTYDCEVNEIIAEVVRILEGTNCLCTAARKVFVVAFVQECPMSSMIKSIK